MANIQNTAANEMFNVAETFGKRVGEMTKGKRWKYLPPSSCIPLVEKFESSLFAPS